MYVYERVGIQSSYRSVRSLDLAEDKTTGYGSLADSFQMEIYRGSKFHEPISSHPIFIGTGLNIYLQKSDLRRADQKGQFDPY